MLVQDGGYVVQETDDDLVVMVNEVFGFPVGHRPGPYAGLNEYLSALLSMSRLRSLCTKEQVLQVVMCIEGTIPFRKQDPATGLPWTQRLYNRAHDTVQKHDLKMDDHELVTAVQRAVVLANNDVGGFCALDTRFFLKNTWNLLPESNPNLRRPGLYTLKVC